MGSLNKIITLLTLTILIVSCIDKKTENKVTATITQKINIDSLRSKLKDNIAFIGDSLLNGNVHVIQNYIDKYQPDSCAIITYQDSLLKSAFEGIKVVDDINGDKRADTVFVVLPFNYCDEGESYCFFDKTLPRLFADSYCCHPENFFVTNDIDEDGINEIGIYHSSCVSHYKSLQIYSLKNGGWLRIGTSTFDILTQDPAEISYKTLVKKIRKNEFEVCNFIDGRTEWVKIFIK
jgi:hypothetical protein